ncbi:MAG TPA: AAA family ATPase, partial [Burkholderiaceae bacterium]|nr:AAA family ATPase [Burkholderiaceae bacterium]
MRLDTRYADGALNSGDTSSSSIKRGKLLMRISSVKLIEFRRFANLEILDIPSTAKLVVLAGPNGSGKSSLFDAFLTRYRAVTGYGWNGDKKYYDRTAAPENDAANRITIEAHHSLQMVRGSIYVRTAYRNDPEFATTTLSKQGAVLDNLNVSKLIQTDATVASNYMRLASQAMEDVFVNEAASTTMGAYRDKILGETREPFKRLFPNLTLVGIGNPLNEGTFRFDKGAVKNFDYQNLSGGEKAAFDLLLDIAVKRRTYTDAVYCIDEPETHMNTKVQGALLQELLGLLPGDSQLWIASHSIGMLRKARELYAADPTSVVFLDFGGHDFDSPTIIK